MKKLRLDLEELAVESFITTTGTIRRGTVKGHDDDEDTTTDCSQACTMDCNDSMGETACGPCPTHGRTQCVHETCAATYCANTCAGHTGPCYETCGYTCYLMTPCCTL